MTIKIKAIVKFILSDDKETTQWLQSDTLDAMNVLVAECVTKGFWADIQNIVHSTGFQHVFVSPNNILRAEVKFI